MVTNSTNIIKTNNLTLNTKKTIAYDVGNLGYALG